MLEEIVCFDGEIRDGPTSIVLVGVHGDETPGLEAFKQILPNLKIERGRVYCGYGNPKSIVKQQRFIDTNLNRMFKPDKLLSQEEIRSYEYQRAQYLKEYLNCSEALLDIHASHSLISKPFLICEPTSVEVRSYLPVDLVVSGFDDFQPGGTDYYMNSQGKIGICVECGYIGDPRATHIAQSCFFAFLKARGHLHNDLKQTEQSEIRLYEVYSTQTDCFRLVKPFDDFEEVCAGQIIGTDGTEEIAASTSGVILFARNRDTKNIEAFSLGKKI